MEHNQHIDETLKRLLEGLETQPDMQSFDIIIKKMNDEKKRRRFFLLFFTGIVFLSGTALVFLITFPTAKLKSPDATSSSELKITQERTVTAVPDQPSPDNGKKPVPFDNNNKFIPSIHRAEVESDPPTQSTREENTKTMQAHKKTSMQGEAGRPTADKEVVTQASNSVPELQVVKYPEGGFRPAENSPVHLPVSADTEYKPGKNPVELSEQQSRLVSDTGMPVESALFLPLVQYQYRDSMALPELKASKPLLPVPEKKFRVYLGISLDPQCTSWLLSENPNTGPEYDHRGGTFPARYLKGRKEQSKWNGTYAGGLKLDLEIRNKYTVSFGWGYQRYLYREKIYMYDSASNTTPLPPTTSNIAYGKKPSASDGYKNSLTYMYYALEASRKFTVNRMVYSIGLGMRMEELQSARYIYVAATNTYYYGENQNKGLVQRLYTGRIRLGWEKELGKRFRFKAGPAVFYSFSSMFNNAYVIKQRPYGLELELSFQVKLF